MSFKESASSLSDIRRRYPSLKYRVLQPINNLPNVKYMDDEVSKIVYPNTEMATALSINVFVVVANLNTNIDILKLRELFFNDEDSDGSFNITNDPESKKSKNKKEGKDSFYNCVQVGTVINKNNINIKFFPNGKIQIAGCKTMEVCHKVTKIAKNFVEYYSGAIINKKSFTLSEQKLGMINCQFRFKFSLDKIKIKNLINENSYHNGGSWRIATIRDNYEGVNAKFWMNETIEKYMHKDKVPKKVEGQVSVLIFGTGSVILTGAKTIEEISKAYFCIIKLVEDNMEKINDKDDSDDDGDESDFEY